MSHETIQWAVTAFLALHLVLMVAFIGRPREPITPSSVITNAVVAGLLLWAVWSL